MQKMQSKSVKFEKRLEDREMHDILRDEFGILPVAGAIFPFTHTRAWKIATVIHYTFMYAVMILTVLNVTYTTYLLVDRTSLMSQSLHLLIIGTVCMICSASLSLQRKKMKRFTTLYNHQYSMCEYAKNEYFERLSKETAAMKMKRVVAWFAMYGLCGIAGLLQPVINSSYGSQTDGKQVNGVWLNLPFLMWCPYDLEHNNVAWITIFLFQAAFLSYCALAVTSAIVLQFHVFDRLLDQFRLTVYGIKTFEQRAKTVFEERYPSLDRRQNKKEFDECFDDCIKQSVLHHRKVVKEYHLQKEIHCYANAIPFYGGAILLGMALITMTADDDPRVGPRYMYGILAFSEFINMYLICKSGQDFADVSVEIFTALYKTRWYLRPVKTQKAIMMMRHGCIRPLKYDCIMLVLNMELFSDLVNSAYSVYNLKKASSS